MKRFEAINMIPFIDIMLVLLAIVLLTATFMSQGKLDIELPKAESAAYEPKENPVELAVDATGALYLDGRALTETELRQRLEHLPTDTPILLRVDASAAFERFARVAGMAQQLGLFDLSILTEAAP